MTNAPAFDPMDPLRLVDQLTEEERHIKESAEQFARSELSNGIAEANREGRFDPDIMKQMGRQGLLGCMVQGYGCAGVGHVAYGLIAQALEWVDSGYRSAFSVQSSLVMHPIDAFGSETLKSEYLPRLASGELIGCFGLTEPDAGSDPGGMKSRAQKVDGGWKLSGSKMWITNSPIADLLIIWAKAYGDSEIKDGSIRGFVVLRDGAKGLETPEIKGKLSLRASITGAIHFDELFVPDDHVLDVTGLKGPFSCLNKARYGIGWGVMGAALCAYETARDYTMDRVLFGKPLAATQLIQMKLADMATDIAYGQLAALHVGRELDAGNCPMEAISILKRRNCQMALGITRTARDMLGGNGISDEYPVMRHMVNLESVNTYEGTADVHALILGRAITGIAAF